MNEPFDRAGEKGGWLEPVVGEVRLAGHWRGKVLLGWADGEGVCGQHWPSVTVKNWERVISDPGKLFEQVEQGQILKASKSTMVVHRQLELGKNQVAVVCKLSRRRNVLRRMIGAFRRSRPSRNWQMGWDLLKAGIPTAVPVAVLEQRVAGLRVGAIMITVSLLPGKTLEQFMREDASGLTAGAQRRLGKELAELVARLHDRGFFHRDLKGVNIFLRPNEAGEVSLYLIDLDGCYHGGLNYRQRVKSIGRLARASLNWPTVRVSERLGFLKLYLRQMGQNENDWKKWWRRIDGQVQRKLRERKKRNGKISPRRHEVHEGEEKKTARKTGPPLSRG